MEGLSEVIELSDGCNLYSYFKYYKPFFSKPLPVEKWISNFNYSASLANNYVKYVATVPSGFERRFRNRSKRTEIIIFNHHAYFPAIPSYCTRIPWVRKLLRSLLLGDI